LDSDEVSALVTAHIHAKKVTKHGKSKIKADKHANNLID